MSPKGGSSHGNPRAAIGYTLVEVVVAMSILAVGILGVIRAFSMSIQRASEDRRLDEASVLAQNLIEEAVATPVDRMETRSGSFGQYGWKTEFEDKSQGLVLVSTEVAWHSKGGAEVFQVYRLFLPPKIDESLPDEQ